MSSDDALDMPFQPGQKVRLKSGGPTMTVSKTGISLAEPRAWCKYFEDGKLTEAAFTPASLELAVRESDIPAFLQVEKLLTRFHQVAQQLTKRHASKNRYTLWINDEYDVQDLLHALLRIDFDDIRPEEWTPSHAGGSCRMDFLLKKEQVVIEAKMTRDNLRDREVGEELIIDIAKYKEHPNCRTLVCFIYDPEQRISNPVGLKRDLEALTSDELAVVVYICQH